MRVMNIFPGSAGKHLLLAGTLVLLICIPALAGDLADGPNGACRLDQLQVTQPSAPSADLTNLSDRGVYVCNLRVYVAKDSSEYWKANDNKKWKNCFMRFAYDTTLNLAYQQNFTRTMPWTTAGLPSGEATIEEDNVFVGAAVFNHIQGYSADSAPGEEGGEFTAYYADAAAKAEPADTGHNSTNGGYSHTVFLEECATPT